MISEPINMSEFVEVELKRDFLAVRETLTRIGIAPRREKKLFQSCHILHKKGKYYIVSFKEMFILDGKQTTLSENDIARRNTIATLLETWGLIRIIDPLQVENKVPLNQIKILAYKDRDDWQLIPKYNMGCKKI